MKVQSSFLTDLGRLYIVQEEDAIVQVGILQPGQSLAYPQEETPLIQTARQQLEEYFAGKRRRFTLPLAPKGTAFAQKVWRALQDIPYGETRSYLQIAQAVGNPRACRAVGMANHRNPIMVIIPCHRVIGSDGSLTGYAGGLEMKRYLLQLEKDTAFAQKKQ